MAAPRIEPDPRVADEVLPRLLKLTWSLWYRRTDAKTWAMARGRIARVLTWPAWLFAEYGLRVGPVDYWRMIRDQLLQCHRQGNLDPTLFTAPVYLGRWFAHWLRGSTLEDILDRYRDRRTAWRGVIAKVAVSKDDSDCLPTLLACRRAIAATRSRKPRRPSADPFQPTLFP